MPAKQAPQVAEPTIDAITEALKKKRSTSITVSGLTDTSNFEIWSEKLVSKMNAACSSIDREVKNRYINMRLLLRFSRQTVEFCAQTCTSTSNNFL